ncbi:MAG TPA: hypothetical protein VGK93_01430 [Candidatus Eisenbacteria bacterium]|jgi:hypothetical protein
MLIAGETLAPEQKALVFMVDAHARRYLLSTRVRPYLEAGLGIYMVDFEKIQTGGAASFANLGSNLGVGLDVPVEEGSGFRLGAAIHYPKIRANVIGGD